MIRLLLLSITALLAWAALSAVRRSLTRRRRGRNPPKRIRAAEPMVACAHCGVHVPRSEAVRKGDDYYCSEAHRRAR